MYSFVCVFVCVDKRTQRVDWDEDLDVGQDLLAQEAVPRPPVHVVADGQESDQADDDIPRVAFVLQVPLIIPVMVPPILLGVSKDLHSCICL